MSLRFLFIPIFTILSTYAGYAQNRLDSINQLPDVVIEAKPIQEIIPVQSLSGKKLEELSVHSVADALRYFSGVQIKDYGGIGGLKTVNVRSMGSEHVGVFFDGIQISNAQNGAVDLGNFSLDNMEALTLYNGQKSDIMQSAKDYASASAIYMVTRKPIFKDKAKNNLVLKAKTGSFDLANGSVLWEHKLSESVSISANSELLYSSGKYKFNYKIKNSYDTTETRRNGDIRYQRTELAAFGKLDGGEWFSKAYLYTSKRGYPGAAVKKDYGLSLLNEDRQKDRNFFIQSSFQKKISSLYTLKVLGKYANNYMNYIMPPESTIKPQDSKYWQQEVYLSSANLFNITNRWNINLASDFQYNKLNAEGDEMFEMHFVQPRRYTLLTSLATSLYLHKVRLQASMLHTFVSDESAKHMAVASDKSVFTPSVIGSYKPFARTDFEIRAFYKRIFRMPTFNDLYYVQIGNRLLKPEYTHQYNLGVVYKDLEHKILTNFSLSIDAYYNQVTDKIIAIPTTNQLVWTMLNLGYVKIKGVDVAFSATSKIEKVLLHAQLNYTYQTARDFTKEKQDATSGSNTHTEDMYGDQIPYVPKHSGSAILNATYKTWNLNYSYIYVSERWMLGKNTNVNHIQPWYTHDMSISKYLKINKLTLKTGVEINNIFNQRYEVVKWYPMPGRNFKINITLTI